MRLYNEKKLIEQKYHYPVYACTKSHKFKIHKTKIDDYNVKYANL